MKYILYPSALICCCIILTIQSCCKDDSGSPPTSPLAGCCENPAIDTTFGNAKVYIPNIFTPNEDGINDIFAVLGDSIKTVIQLEVRNQSNQVVFLKEHIPYSEYIQWLHFDHFWDGKSNGEIVLGLYEYTTTLEAENGMIATYKGEICNYPCGELVGEDVISIDGCQFPAQSDQGQYNPLFPPAEAVNGVCFN